MEKYKALREYIEECEKKGIENSFINKLPIRNTSLYMQVNSELNSLLKEHFNCTHYFATRNTTDTTKYCVKCGDAEKLKDGFVNITRDPVINDKV